MKPLLTTLLFTLLLNLSHAQKITMDKDTVTIDDNKLFILKTAKKASIFNEDASPEYSIRNMNNKELMYYKDKTFIFMSDGTKAAYDGKTKATIIAKYIVDNELIAGDSINADAKKNFLIKYAATTTATTLDGNGLVARDRNGNIFVSGSKIKQAGILIGTIKQSSQIGDSYQVEWVYDIKLPDGTLIARSYSKDVNGTSVRIVTAKDNKTHYHSFANSFDAENSIAKFLVDKLYL